MEQTPDPVRTTTGQPEQVRPPEAPTPLPVPPADVERDYLDWQENLPPLPHTARFRLAMIWVLTAAISVAACTALFIFIRRHVH